MTEVNVYHLIEDLERDEGLKRFPYRDTVGKLTIGIGRNLDDNGISEDEAKMLLRNDVADILAALRTNIVGWSELGEARQRALANMGYNMGWPRLSLFLKMRVAIAEGDFDLAASEALNSRWAKQVGARAQRVAALLRLGE
jgi:lysozyme